MARKVKVGIVGCGQAGEKIHARGFNGVPGVEIAALFDTELTRAEGLRGRAAPKATVHSDMDAFLATDIEGVAIATPNRFHYPGALAALKAGKHVLCEKPLAGTLDEARRLVAAARRAKRILQVNQSLRYSPPYVTVAGLIEKGSIGEVLHVRCIRAGGTLPNKGWSPGADWFVSKKEQGGIIFDIAVHMADVLRWLAGEVKEVSAVTSTLSPGITAVDTVTSTMRFESGATGTLELSWAYPVGSGALEIYGTKGRIRMGVTEEPIEMVRVVKGQRVTSFPPVRKKVKDSFRVFADAVRGLTETRTPGELGRDAVAICEAIAEAGATRGVVKVKRSR